MTTRPSIDSGSSVTNSFTTIHSPETALTELSTNDSPRRNIEPGRYGNIQIFCDHQWNLPESAAPLVSAEVDYDDRDTFREPVGDQQVAADQQKVVDGQLVSGGKPVESDEAAVPEATQQASALFNGVEAREVVTPLIERPTFIPEKEKAAYKRNAYILQVSGMLGSDLQLSDTIQFRAFGFQMA